MTNSVLKPITILILPEADKLRDEQQNEGRAVMEVNRSHSYNAPLKTINKHVAVCSL